MDLTEHLASFQQIWEGGVYAGDPLQPLQSSWGLFGYLGAPYAITLTCIGQYVDADTVALSMHCRRSTTSSGSTSASDKHPVLAGQRFGARCSRRQH